jgi:hypothetical protein
MSLTLADLRTKINDSRRDTTTSFVSDQEILRYLNEALRYLQTENDWDFNEVSAQIAYVDGTNNYKLSAIGSNTFKKPIDLYYNDDYKFSYIDPEEFEYLKDQSLCLFSTDSKDLKIKTSFGTNNLTLWYYSTCMAQTSGGSWQENLVDATDQTLLPSFYEDVLVKYALLLISEKEGNDRDIVRYSKRLDEMISKMKTEFRSRSVEFQTHMRNPRDYTALNYSSKEDALKLR